MSQFAPSPLVLPGSAETAEAAVDAATTSGATYSMPVAVLRRIG
jgi:hypothetical protein